MRILYHKLEFLLSIYGPVKSKWNSASHFMTLVYHKIILVSMETSMNEAKNPMGRAFQIMLRIAANL